MPSWGVGLGSVFGVGLGSFLGGGVGSCFGAGVGSFFGAGVGSVLGAGVGSVPTTGVGSPVGCADGDSEAAGCASRPRCDGPRWRLSRAAPGPPAAAVATIRSAAPAPARIPAARQWVRCFLRAKRAPAAFPFRPSQPAAPRRISSASSLSSILFISNAGRHRILHSLSRSCFIRRKPLAIRVATVPSGTPSIFAISR